MNGKSECVDSADDAVLEIGFEDNFVTSPHKTNPATNNAKFPPAEEPSPFPQIEADPFSGFESIVSNSDQSDPFTTVITRAPEQPAHIHQEPEKITPTGTNYSNSHGPLIDIDDFATFLPRSSSTLSAVTSDEPLFSSGSQSSHGSEKRFSSSASSSSDNGLKKEQMKHSSTGGMI